MLIQILLVFLCFRWKREFQNFYGRKFLGKCRIDRG